MNIYLKYGFKVLLMIYVVFVFVEVKDLVILELGNKFLNEGLKVLVVVNGMLSLIIVVVILIFVKVI